MYGPNTTHHHGIYEYPTTSLEFQGTPSVPNTNNPSFSNYSVQMGFGQPAYFNSCPTYQEFPGNTYTSQTNVPVENYLPYHFGGYPEIAQHNPTMYQNNSFAPQAFLNQPDYTPSAPTISNEELMQIISSNNAKLTDLNYKISLFEASMQNTQGYAFDMHEKLNALYAERETAILTVQECERVLRGC